MNNNIINLEPIKKAREITIDNYKKLITKEYSKKGIKYSGNISDMIKKIKPISINDCVLVIIEGGSYADYFNNCNEIIGSICLFDKEGNIIYKSNKVILEEKAIAITNNNVYIFKKNNTVINYNCNKEIPTITTINNIKKPDIYYKDYSESLVGFQTDNNEYLIYNQDENRELFTCQEITDQYEEYNCMEKGLILVRKKITYENLYSDIEFFIDKKGNIVSPLIDCTHGIIHSNYNHVRIDFAFNIVKIFLKQEKEKERIIKATVKRLKKSLI